MVCSFNKFIPEFSLTERLQKTVKFSDTPLDAGQDVGHSLWNGVCDGVSKVGIRTRKQTMDGSIPTKVREATFVHPTMHPAHEIFGLADGQTGLFHAALGNRPDRLFNRACNQCRAEAFHGVGER